MVFEGARNDNSNSVKPNMKKPENTAEVLTSCQRGTFFFFSKAESFIRDFPANQAPFPVTNQKVILTTRRALQVRQLVEKFSPEQAEVRSDVTGHARRL
jgi:hypothetical protein